MADKGDNSVVLDEEAYERRNFVKRVITNSLASCLNLGEFVEVNKSLLPVMSLHPELLDQKSTPTWW